MRLIDADALTNKIKACIAENSELSGDETKNLVYFLGIDEGLKLAFDFTGEAPTVDAEPARHGRWVRRGQDIYCSCCKAESGYTAFGASAFSARCPHCGAKMDEEGAND